MDKKGFPENIYKRQIINLGAEFGPAFEGIYSPGYQREEINKFMTSYYESEEGARSQDKKFDITDYYHKLLLQALKKTGTDKKGDEITILDLGCGFGSTTLPLLKIFPKADVIASELSIQMLSILKEKLSEEESQRCFLMQLNAEEPDFEENSFDLVVGAAILHHLFHPEKVFEYLAKILKPGGYAIFFEPFESGYDMMKLLYHKLIDHFEAKDRKLKYLAPFIRIKNRIAGNNKDLYSFKRYLVGTATYWQKMINPDKNDDFFRGIDDKWLFTRNYFESIKEKNSFGGLEIYSLYEGDDPFTTGVLNHFKGNGFGSPPEWALKMIGEFEENFTREQKKEFMTEGCIIFKK